MTTATALLTELDRLGVAVRVEDGNLHLRPRERVAPDLLVRLRRQKAGLVGALRLDRLLALDDDQVDAWAERVAICTVDGGLGQDEAENVAWRQIEGCLSQRNI